MKYYIGVDIGGTNIKAGVVDENAQLVSKISLKTNAADGYKSVLAESLTLSNRLCSFRARILTG